MIEPDFKLFAKPQEDGFSVQFSLIDRRIGPDIADFKNEFGSKYFAEQVAGNPCKYGRACYVDNVVTLRVTKHIYKTCNHKREKEKKLLENVFTLIGN